MLALPENATSVYGNPRSFVSDWSNHPLYIRQGGLQCTNNYFTLGQVSRLLGRKPHLITYAIASGHVPEPPMRISNKRVFGEADLERLARYFNVPMPRSNRTVSTEAITRILAPMA